MVGHDSPEYRQEKLRVAGVFSRVAQTYDQIGPRYFARFGARLTELAGVRRGQTVLDIACGRGASLLPAAQRVGRHGRVVGVDLAQGMVDELARDIGTRGLSNAEVRLMDGEHLAFPADAFDHVLAGFCVYFFERLEEALAEMRRVLTPGGHLAISTWGTTSAEWQWLDRLIDAYLPESRDDETVDEASRVMESPIEMRALMLRTGFVRAEVVTEAGSFTYADSDEWWNTLWSGAYRDDLERIEAQSGTPGIARLEAEARDHLRAMSPMSVSGIREVMPVLYTLAVKPDRERGV